MHALVVSTRNLKARKGLVENGGYVELISMQKVEFILVIAAQKAFRWRFRTNAVLPFCTVISIRAPRALGCLHSSASNATPCALETQSKLWSGHGCSRHRMRLEHEQKYGLGIDAPATACSWNKNEIIVWAPML